MVIACARWLHDDLVPCEERAPSAAALDHGRAQLHEELLRFEVG
jgi:hypothetical protein